MEIQKRISVTEKKRKAQQSKQSVVLVMLSTIAVIALLVTAGFQVMTLYVVHGTPDGSDVVSMFRSSLTNAPLSTGRTELDLVNEETTQAVFLTSDQVYFGRIVDITNETIVLTSVVYPEEQKKAAEEGQEASSTITLKRLGDSEFHQSENELVIMRANVLYWQNLQKDSRVTKGIEEYEKKEADEEKNTTNTNARAEDLDTIKSSSNTNETQENADESGAAQE